MAQHSSAHSIRERRENRLGEAILILLALAALILVGYLGKRLEPAAASPSLLEYASLEDSNAAPVVALLGEFRANLSYLLFMKTEQYLHAGVRYRPRTQREIDMGVDEIHHDFILPDDEHAVFHHDMHDDDHDHHHDHGHSHGTQVVPRPEWDKRGIFGDLDRAIHPYEAVDGEVEHGDPEEMLPWYRLATYLNPRFVKAYVIGAFVIAAYGGDVDQAEQFLREGERLNPESLEIKEALGRLWLYRKKDPAKAKPLLQAAIQLGRNRESLSEDERAALRNAYTNLILLEWKSNEDLNAAQNALQEGLTLFPDDRAFLRLKEQIEG